MDPTWIHASIMDLYTIIGLVYPKRANGSTLDPRILHWSMYPKGKIYVMLHNSYRSMNHCGFTYPMGISGSTLDPWILHGSMHPIWIYEPLWTYVYKGNQWINFGSMDPTWIHASYMDLWTIVDLRIQRESMDQLWIHGSYMDPCILNGSMNH